MLSTRSLPLRLFTFLALPVILLLVLVTFHSVNLHRVAIRDLITRHNTQAVKSVGANLSAQIEQRAELLMGIAAKMQIEEGQDVELLLPSWIEIVFDDGVALYDDDGQLIASTAQAYGWQTSNPLRADLMQEMLAVRLGDERYMPMIVQGKNSTRIAVMLASTTTSDQVVRAIGIFTLESLELPIVLEALQTAKSSSITLATRDGLILHQSNPTLVGSHLTDSAYNEGALRGDIGFNYASDQGGRELLITYAPVTDPSWTLIQQEVWTETISPSMRASQAAPLALLPGLAIALVGALFAINAIVRPLQRLETAAADLAAGNFQSISAPVGGIDEVQHLQESLQKMADQLQKAQELMRHYIGQITRAQEDERRRLARELHDHTIQALIALDHREQVLRRYLNDDPAGARVLDELREMTAETIDELRRTIRAMRPIYLEDLGLIPALEALARDISASSEVDVHFEKTGSPRRLSAELELTLYRVAQEALNNAWRHSKATDIWMSVRFADDAVTVSVRDNGAGFRAPRKVTDLPRNSHFGLIGMYERAELAGASLNIQSKQGKGTTVTVRASETAQIPIN